MIRMTTCDFSLRPETDTFKRLDWSAMRGLRDPCQQCKHNTKLDAARVFCSALQVSLAPASWSVPEYWRRSFLGLRCQLRSSRPLAPSTSFLRAPAWQASLGDLMPVIARCSELSQTAPARSTSPIFHGLCECVATVQFLDATRTIDLS